MKKKLILILVMAFNLAASRAQIISLDSILNETQKTSPSLRMVDAEIRSMDEAAKGARSWMPPELSTGLWMVPYNPGLWKKSGGETGMGQYMVGAQQMFPNKKKLDAEAKYMETMSSVEKEKKNASLNELFAEAKKNYYALMILNKKLVVLNLDEKLLDFMIRNAELRYRNGLGKINAYYKATAALGTIQSMRLMLENEILQKKIALNTLMNRDKALLFDIDTVYKVKDFTAMIFDSAVFYGNRSDLKALDKDILLNRLKQESERAKLKPEFGIRYDHMFGFGGFPMQYSLMGMVKIPMANWSSRMNKANVESLKWKNEALRWQKQMMANEYSGMATSMRNEIELKRKQISLYEEKIIPALNNNYKTMQLGYEQNTEELFMLYDAWETLNMTQLDYLDQLQQLLFMQVELERVLEIK